MVCNWNRSVIEKLTMGKGKERERQTETKMQNKKEDCGTSSFDNHNNEPETLL